MLLVDLNWDYLMGFKGPAVQKWYGRGISAALMYDYPLNKNGNVSAAAGGAITNHNYYTNALVSKIDSTNQVEFLVVPGSIKKKGKLSVTYVDVPLELRFRTNEDKRGDRWKFAVGARIGYRVNVHEKIINDKDIKIKTYYYPQVGLFRYGLTARAGYGAMMLTAFYSISPLFDSGVGVKDMNAFSVGLTIIPF